MPTRMTRMTRTGSPGMTHATLAMWPRSHMPASQHILIGIDFLHSVCAVAFKDL